MMKKMKNSGINYCGDIPFEWKVIPNKYIFELSKKTVDNPDNWQLLSLTTKGIKAKADGDTAGKVPDNYNGYQIVQPGDLVMCLFDLDVSAVFSGYSTLSGMISPAYKIYRAKRNLADNKYMDYWFSFVFSGRHYKQYSKSLRYTVNTDEFGQLLSILPPLKEQIRIVNFLDRECKKIEDIILEVQKQIDTLDEYRRAKVIELTTKGIGYSGKTKPSGIEYVGLIPYEWSIHPLYYYFYEGKIKNSKCEEQNLLSLSYGNIVRKDINTSEGLLPASFSTYNIVQKNDIIIRPTDLQNDKRSLRTGLVNERGIITSAYIDLKPKKNVNSSYYHYLLHAYDLMKVFYNMGNGVRQGLNYDEFSKLLVLEPSSEEQEAITNQLDEIYSVVDSIINSKKEQIKTLEEYKKSIIYEYVTGKKEVPNE